MTLKERSGSSLPAIKKVMSAKHPSLPAGWEKVLNLQLKKLSESKKLVKVRAPHPACCLMPQPCSDVQA